jgi:hypothetical protein
MTTKQIDIAARNPNTKESLETRSLVDAPDELLGTVVAEKVLEVLGTSVVTVLTASGVSRLVAGVRVKVMVQVAPTVVSCVVVGPSPSLTMAGQLQSYWRMYVDEAVKS